MDKRTKLVVAGLAGLTSLAALYFLGHFAFDDLYISFRYAEHLANGQGLTWNVGQAPVEGYTNFLLVLIMALIHHAGLSPLYTVQVLNILITALGAWLIARLASHLLRNSKPQFQQLGTVIAAIAYVANPYVWMNALSGLETTLFAVLILWCLDRVARHKDVYRTFALCFVLVLTRPDGILFGILLGAVLLILSDKRTKTFAAILLCFALPVALYEVWRLQYFGSALPNTFYVKVSSAVNVLAGRAYIKRYLLMELPVVILCAMGMWKWRGEPVVIAAILWCIGITFFYLIPKPIQGFYFRFVFSAMVLWTLLGIVVLVHFTAKVKETYRWMLLTVAMIAQLSLNWAFAKGEEQQAVLPEATAMYQEIGVMLSKMPGRDSLSFAYQDAGVIPYYSKMNQIDLVGLNDKSIAKARTSEEIVTYLRSASPEIILLPAERPREGDSCWTIFRQGHGKMGELGPALLTSGFLDNYQLVARYLYIGYDVLIYIKGGIDPQIAEHMLRYPYRSAMIAGPIGCLQ